MQDIDNLSKYGQSFQSKVVSALLTDNKFLDQISEIVTPKFFESDANKWIVSEIVNYHTEYRQAPTMDAFKVSLSKLDNKGLQTTIVEQLRHIYTQVGNVTDLAYIKTEFTSFCKNQNLKQIKGKENTLENIEVKNYQEIFKINYSFIIIHIFY